MSSNAAGSYPPEKAGYYTAETHPAQGSSLTQDDDSALPPPPAYEEHSGSSTASTYNSVKYHAGPSHNDYKQWAGPSIAVSPYAPLPEARDDSLSRAGSISSATSGTHSTPPSFQRPPPSTLSYAPFRPTALVGHSSELGRGFPPIPPPSAYIPHPFASHDVNEHDWLRFLEDIKAAAQAAPMNKFVSGVAPMARRIPLPLTAVLVSKGVEMHMKSRKKGPVGEAVDHWNHYFFHPRRMHIVLAQGKMSYSGPEAPPPDMVRGKSFSGEERILRHGEDNEDEGDDDGASVIIDEALQKKRSWTAAYQKQRQRRMDWSMSTNERWRLVVSFKDYVL